MSESLCMDLKLMSIGIPVDWLGRGMPMIVRRHHDQFEVPERYDHRESSLPHKE